MPNIQIDDEQAGLEAWEDQEEDYVNFDPTDYVDNPAAFARMKACPNRNTFVYGAENSRP